MQWIIIVLSEKRGIRQTERLFEGVDPGRRAMRLESFFSRRILRILEQREKEIRYEKVLSFEDLADRFREVPDMDRPVGPGEDESEAA